MGVLRTKNQFKIAIRRNVVDKFGKYKWLVTSEPFTDLYFDICRIKKLTLTT